MITLRPSTSNSMNWDIQWETFQSAQNSQTVSSLSKSIICDIQRNFIRNNSFWNRKQHQIFAWIPRLH